MKIISGKEEDWELTINNNKDMYGAGVIRYVLKWTSMMEDMIDSGSTVAESAEKTQFTADDEGITGFMYGCAVSIISQVWEYGEDLKKWHNKEYDYTGDGVVNPAMVTISK